MNIRQQIKKSNPLSPSRPRQNLSLNLIPTSNTNNGQSQAINNNMAQSPISNNQNKEPRPNLVLGK